MPLHVGHHDHNFVHHAALVLHGGEEPVQRITQILAQGKSQESASHHLCKLFFSSVFVHYDAPLRPEPELWSVHVNVDQSMSTDLCL